MTSQHGLSRRSSGSEFRAMKAILLKEVRYLFRYPTWILAFIALPYMLTSMVSTMGRFVGGDNAGVNFAMRTGTENFFVYQILGGALWMIGILVFTDIGESLRTEQLRGTLEQNFLAPVKRAYMLVALTFTHMIMALILFFTVIVTSMILFTPVSFSVILQDLMVLVVGVIPLYGIGFLYGAFVIRFKEPYAVTGILNVLFAVLTGTFYPVYLLPQWVQAASWFFPNTHALETLRAISLFNKTVVDMYGHLIVLGVMVFLYPIFGYWVFRRVENAAKRRGDLAKY